jgi:hypothetical protein
MMDGNFDMNAMNMMGMMMNPMMQYQALQMQAAQVSVAWEVRYGPRLTLVDRTDHDGSAEPSATTAHAHAANDAAPNAQHGDAADADDDGRKCHDDDGGQRKQL